MPELPPKLDAFADLTALCRFLGALERDQPELTSNEVTITEAIDAFCRVTKIERWKLTNVSNAKLKP